MKRFIGTLFLVLAIAGVTYAAPATAEATAEPTSRWSTMTPVGGEVVADATEDLVVVITPTSSDPEPVATEVVPEVIEGDVVIVTPVDPEPWYAKYIAGFFALIITVGGIGLAIVKAANAFFTSTMSNVGQMSVLEQAFKVVPKPAADLIASLAMEVEALGGNARKFFNELSDDEAYILKQVKPKTPPTA
jgi:hypothetical protein